jgi:hypothetical protein
LGILHNAGFSADESRLARLGGKTGAPSDQSQFKKPLREKAYGFAKKECRKYKVTIGTA